MGCFLGLRVEEAIMQRWEDLDLDAVNPRTGRSEPVAHVGAHSGWAPKDKGSRTIPICRELHDILTRHRARRKRRKDDYVLEPMKKQPKSKGTKLVYRFDPRRLWNRVIERVLKAGGKRITPYGMRHTFASNALSQGISDVKVARWLGHADTKMVHRHYGHLMAYDDDINRLNG